MSFVIVPIVLDGPKSFWMKRESIVGKSNPAFKLVYVVAGLGVIYLESLFWV